MENTYLKIGKTLYKDTDNELTLDKVYSDSLISIVLTDDTIITGFFEKNANQTIEISDLEYKCISIPYSDIKEIDELEYNNELEETDKNLSNLVLDVIINYVQYRFSQFIEKHSQYPTTSYTKIFDIPQGVVTRGGFGTKGKIVPDDSQRKESYDNIDYDKQRKIMVNWNYFFKLSGAVVAGGNIGGGINILEILNGSVSKNTQVLNLGIDALINAINNKSTVKSFDEIDSDTQNAYIPGHFYFSGDFTIANGDENQYVGVISSEAITSDIKDEVDKWKSVPDSAPKGCYLALFPVVPWDTNITLYFHRIRKKPSKMFVYYSDDPVEIMVIHAILG